MARVTLQRAPVRAMEGQRVGRAPCEQLGMLTCHSGKAVMFRATAECCMPGCGKLYVAMLHTCMQHTVYRTFSTGFVSCYYLL
jgi:hypothetical protein